MRPILNLSLVEDILDLLYRPWAKLKSKLWAKPVRTTSAGSRPAKPFALNSIAAAEVSNDSLPWAEPKSPRGQVRGGSVAPFGVNPDDLNGGYRANSNGKQSRSGSGGRDSRQSSPSTTPNHSPNSQLREVGKGSSSNEQVDFTGRVKKDGPLDTSHVLLDLYLGKVTDTKGVDRVNLSMLRTVGSEATAAESERWRAAVQQRVKKEISSWRKVGEPFVKYIGFAEVDGALAVLTQLMESTGAKEYLDGKPIEEKRRLILDYAHALSRLHTRNLSHGCIEPQYFLVNKSGKARVAGFGFPRMVEEELAKTSLSEDYRRSARYTAPEVTAGQQADVKSDVYSFALVALALLTGKRPFSSTEQEAALMQRISEGEDVFDKDFPELQSDPSRNIFKYSLLKDPDLRPSMDKLWRDLATAWNIKI